MDFHTENLNFFCRICGCRAFSSGKTQRITTYSVSEHWEHISRCFNVDVRNDFPDVHPGNFCGSCKAYITRTIKKKCTEPTPGTGTVERSCMVWEPHKRVGCSVCSAMETASKPGRRKKSRSIGRSSTSEPSPALSTLSTSSDEVFNFQARDVDIRTLLDLATPSYKACKDLSVDRFVTTFSALVCGICKQIVNQAVETPCCSKPVCANCLFDWLGSTCQCPECKHALRLSNIKPLHVTTHSILRELPVHCDNAGQTSLEGCSQVMPLHSLASHCSNCSPSSIKAIAPSTTVGEVLTAPKELLQGDTANKLLSHLINSKSVDGKLEQHTGGPKKLWHRVVNATVSSSAASTRTLERREQSLSALRQSQCGGLAGSRAQLVHATKVMPREKRDSLLQEAGVLGSSPQPGIGLALKADLQLPWSRLRKLRRYFKEFGVKFESEHAMRHQILDQLPFPLVAHELPLFNKHGAVSMCPVCSFTNLVSVILHYISLNHQAGSLTWRDSSIPSDEIWVKIGGDHGGDSFKFCFQIANVAHPNSLSNTIPFLVFVAKDTPSNLATVLEPYQQQLQDLSSGKVKWQDKTLVMTLFGDYEFMTKSYGLSGSSGVRPCLFCLSTKTEFQTSTVHGPLRSLQLLRADHEKFVAAGSALSSAKHYNNVIRSPILPIELEEICIPVLHLDLGIFPWLYEAMLRDSDALDLELACSGANVPGSDSFTIIAEKQKALQEKQEKYSQEAHQASVYEAQLQWLVSQADTIQPTLPQGVQVEQIAAQLHKQWNQHHTNATTLAAEIAQQEHDLSAAKVKNGPCTSSFEPVLSSNRIDRQAYHSGAFIGNHVHKALKNDVLKEIVSAPLALLHTFFHPPLLLSDRQHLLLQHALELRERYASLFSAYAACRSIFATSERASPKLLQSLQGAITAFMALVRSEVIERQKKTITPKLHLLECHTVPCMERFGVCLGLLGEQGGESIHHKFNSLRSSLQNMPKEVDRLRTLVTQYVTSTIPTFNALVAQPRKRKSSS